MTDANNLHLQSLSIQGFRGIEALSIPRLGRVTLLAGKNGVGKTTVLDAVRIYAARGSYAVLNDLLRDRGEMYVTTNHTGRERVLPDYRSLFHDSGVSQGTSISIGPEEKAKERLEIEQATSREGVVLTVVYRGEQHVLPFSTSANDSAPMGRELRRLPGGSPPTPIEHQLLGPGLLSDDELAHLWDDVALTDQEDRAIDALRLVLDSDIIDAALITDRQPDGRRLRRRAMVRLMNQKRPSPLKSLGDGVLRLFGVALALANSRDGFLLIDEAENGIHYSVQRDYWRMVLQAAHQNNVQVFATTHSSDCIRGFAEAAAELEDTEGILIRLSRRDGHLRAVEYPEEELAIAAEQGIEVR